MERNYKFKVKSIKKIDKELCKFMKVCSNCGELKLTIEYSKKNKNNFKIRQSQCKKCLYENSKKYKCICKQCNKEFSARKKNSIFCSRECQGKWNSENRVGENNPLYNKIKCNCEYCGEVIYKTPYEIKTKKHLFCSRECRGKWNSENLVGENNPLYSRIYYNCEWCGKETNTNKYQYDRVKNHFCCQACADKFHGEQLKGKSNPDNKITYNCEWCGKEATQWRYHYNNNKHHFCSNKCAKNWKSRNNTIIKCDFCGKEYDIVNSKISQNNHFCSRECQGKWNSENKVGENHPSYNPNITQEEREQKRNYPEYTQFIQDVLKRDNWTCQLTGQVGGKLEVHHLDCYADFKDKRTDVNNGITLSKEIHKLFHKLYGNRHNTKEQFEEFKERYRIGEFKEVV